MSDNTCGPTTHVGQRVVFAFPKNGYEHDVQTAAKYLTPDATYTVSSVRVEGWSTDLTLEEVPHVRFNSVQFGYAKPKGR